MASIIFCQRQFLNWFLSEELRHLIGTETTRQGVMLVFNMFQHAKLNRRLVYVMLEGLLETIFPDNKFQETFRKLHSQSPRLKKQNKKDVVAAASCEVKGASRKRSDWSKTEVPAKNFEFSVSRFLCSFSWCSRWCDEFVNAMTYFRTDVMINNCSVKT